MELRIAWDTGEGFTVDGIPLGEPGEKGVVKLAQVDLIEATGSSEFEFSGKDMVATVDGVRYVVQPALVKHTADGTPCDSFLFLGVATSPKPD